MVFFNLLYRGHIDVLLFFVYCVINAANIYLVTQINTQRGKETFMSKSWRVVSTTLRTGPKGDPVTSPMLPSASPDKASQIPGKQTAFQSQTRTNQKHSNISSALLKFISHFITKCWGLDTRPCTYKAITYYIKLSYSMSLYIMFYILYYYNIYIYYYIINYEII